MTARGNAKVLQRLIVWARGYFPTGMPHIASWSPTIGGRKLNLLELQRCIGDDEPSLAAAMKTLLLDGDFVVEKRLAWQDRLPSSNDEGK